MPVHFQLFQSRTLKKKNFFVVFLHPRKYSVSSFDKIISRSQTEAWGSKKNESLTFYAHLFIDLFCVCLKDKILLKFICLGISLILKLNCYCTDTHRYGSIFKKKAGDFSQNLTEWISEGINNILFILQKESLHEKRDWIVYVNSQNSELHFQGQMIRSIAAQYKEELYCPIKE